MTFIERFTQLCADRNMRPCSTKAEEFLGINKGTISAWKKNNSTPSGKYVRMVANAFHVSTDYLLGITDDPTVYDSPEITADMSGPVLDAFNGDTQQAAAFHAAVDNDVTREQEPYILRLYKRLDKVDQIKVESYIEGMLTADKYQLR